MKPFKIFTFLVLLVFTPALAQQVDPSVQNSAGGISQFENWSLLSSVGQPAPVGKTAHDSLEIASGFLNTLFAPPSLTHSPPDSGDQNQEISINVDVTDESGILGVFLSFRRGGDAKFDTVQIAEAGGNIQASIPASKVTSRGVEYFIFARDVEGNIIRQPSSGFFSVQVRVGGEGEVKVGAQGSPVPQPAGTEQTAYRLISVPLNLDNKSPDAVLVDDLGRYNKRKWRFFEYTAEQVNVEFPDNPSAMLPGKAFWLIVREENKVIDTGPGITNITSTPFQIPLHPGWNMIGNPFNFPIPLSNLSRTSEQSVELRFFGEGPDGNVNWNDPINDPVTRINPFEGYAIFNPGPNFDALIINPDLSSSTSPLPKSPAEQLNWAIQIIARCQKARDADNYAGVALDARNGRDVWDRPEPPVIGEYVSLYFPHPEWNLLSKTFSTDFRSEPVDGDVWEFEVTTNIRDQVQLTFQGINSVPNKWLVWLVDESLQIGKNLRESNNYIIAETFKANKILKLVVGDQEFLQHYFPEIHSIPETYELSQNFPNPFNPATTIRYALPVAERVTLKIYNLLGKEVVTLVDHEKQSSGYHVVVWNGKDQAGQQVASGIYLYRLITEKFSIVKKMILMK